MDNNNNYIIGQGDIALAHVDDTFINFENGHRKTFSDRAGCMLRINRDSPNRVCSEINKCSLQGCCLVGGSVKEKETRLFQS